MANLPLGCNAPGKPSAGPAAGHDAANGGDEKPEKLSRLQLQNIAKKGRCGQQVQKHAVERYAAGQCQQQKAWVRQQNFVALHQRLELKGLAFFCGQGFWQKLHVDRPEQNANQRQKPEHGLPAQMHKQPAAHHGRQRRGNAEEDGDLCHQTLSLSGWENISNNRA